MKLKILLCLMLLSSVCSAQPPWRARLFVHYSEDPTGKVITDTVWFGCDSLGAEGYQVGLDVVDTIYDQNKTFFSDPLAQSQLGLPSHYNLKTNIKAFNKNGTTSFKLKANGWVFAVSWDTTEFIYEQPDFKLFSAVLKCYDCYLGLWERELYGIFGRYTDGTPTFGGRDSIDILQGNGMELEIVLRFKDTSTVGFSEAERKNFVNFELQENPVTNKVSINFKNNFTGSISLSNNLGQILYTSNIQNQTNHNCNIEHLRNGIYYLQISTPEIQSKPIKLLKL